MSDSRKVKILDMSYDYDKYLFNVLVKDIKTDKKTTLCWRGIDIGVTNDTPEKIINDFCQKMIGQEKNLVIQQEEESLNVSNLKDATESQLKQFDDSFNSYPVKEIAESINKNGSADRQ